MHGNDAAARLLGGPGTDTAAYNDTLPSTDGVNIASTAGHNGPAPLPIEYMDCASYQMDVSFFESLHNVTALNPAQRVAASVANGSLSHLLEHPECLVFVASNFLSLSQHHNPDGTDVSGRMQRWLQRVLWEPLASTFTNRSAITDASTATAPSNSSLIAMLMPWIQSSSQGTLESGSSSGGSKAVNASSNWGFWSLKQIAPLFFPSHRNDLNATEHNATSAAKMSSMIAQGWGLAKRTSAVGLAYATRLSYVAIASTLSASASVVQYLISFLLFFNMLFYLLSSESLWLDQVLTYFNERDKTKLRSAFGSVVQQLFTVNAKVCAFHALYTFIVFTAFDVHFPYTAAAISAVSGVVPFFPTSLLAVPAAIECLIRGGIAKAVTLFVLHWLGLVYADWYIFEEVANGHPAVLGLSIVAGMAAFGVQGAVLGPLLVSALVASYVLFGETAVYARAGARALDPPLESPRVRILELGARPRAGRDPAVAATADLPMMSAPTFVKTRSTSNPPDSSRSTVRHSDLDTSDRY
jgi:predicted PurR-regulated permease PerM